jgi:hypothetical protein
MKDRSLIEGIADVVEDLVKKRAKFTGWMKTLQTYTPMTDTILAVIGLGVGWSDD